MPTEEMVRLRSGERSEESRNISLENGVKIVGQESSQFRENILQEGQNRGGRSAAENENHEGGDKENQSERKNVCEQQLVGQ